MPARDYYLPQRRLVSQEDASIIENPQIPRSRFTGSWSHLTTFDAGYLVPFLVDDILPGDHMKYDVAAYVRMSTPLFPIFMNQRIDTHFFFVPYRILWTHFVNMMGEQITPVDSIAYTVPIISSLDSGPAIGSIYDHMELPTTEQIPDGEIYNFSALPLRAYNKIWNAWFRDQNIQSSVVEETDDGPDLVSQYQLLRRAKSHDYFTSALPWPQKFTAPTIPLAGNAPVLGLGHVNVSWTAGPLNNVRESNLQTTTYAWYKQLWDAAAQNQVFIEGTAVDGYPAVFADLSAVSGISINTLRQAWLVQSLLERDARGGTRYVENIRAHYGVVSPDFRLQRPEYIGGGQTPLIITPIAQTAPTAELPVGALGGTGTAQGRHSASYAATEHGVIIGLISVKSELAYQQGMERQWSRQTRYDFAVPALAGLGEQAILRQEIYCTGNGANDEAVFGYQERFQEYRTKVSRITGMFKSNITGTLDAWHLAQHFGSAPTLSDAFIVDNPPMDRVLAAGEEAELQQYLADIYIERTAVRPLPMFGTPVTLGRF